MKKLFLILLLVSTLIFLSCDNKDMEEEETGPFSLIGTWEAEREFTHTDGVQWNEKNTLIFYETEFRQEIVSKSKTREVTRINAGKYSYDDNYIMYIDTYDYKEDGSKGYGPYAPPEKFRYPYKFINKNTLETNGFGDTGGNIIDRVYKRKN